MSSSNHDKIIEYYSASSHDYGQWSDDFNMHFGYLAGFKSWFSLEAMLQSMNTRVYRELAIAPQSKSHLLDMGCGFGATARAFSKAPGVDQVTGITLVEMQVEQAMKMSEPLAGAGKIRFEQGDYHRTRWPDEHFDGAYALESACHSQTSDKDELVQEAYRVIKHGARFAIGDGFIVGDAPLNAFTDHCYRMVCQHWSLGKLPEMTQLKRRMLAAGFEDIRIEDASWKVAPSMLYIPYLSARYIAKRLFGQLSGRDRRRGWGHVVASLYLVPMAFCLSRFRYYIVSGRKP